ncbi:hypothetical protein SAMN04515674_1025 [Pseudarcicella hirudinis]|uniref:C1q domain-containing protein n=1 Tax=Pseudarcicella hirudinis TaxID=1079859 RepID=A0A1I5NLE2_9BACT|nr:hypothetical protein [Pseudarcicella hirudinis]SFP22537.1 hypothetical protein SAMN04515674_1025 [Pseudarcicella hirudinis]
MKKLSILCALVLMGTTAFAQQRISDGTSNAAINPNAIVEIQSNNKGLLLPRVALTGTANAAPLSAHVAGMHVYNTATVGDVTPGEYFNDGKKWKQVLADIVPAYYTRLAWSGTANQNFPASVGTQINVGTWTIPKTGKYLILYHSFLRSVANSNSVVSFYVRPRLNTTIVRDEETYLYIGNYVNTHYSTVITATVGQVLSFDIAPTSAMYIEQSLGWRNAFDIIFVGE